MDSYCGHTMVTKLTEKTKTKKHAREKMGNLGISLPGNLAFGGKYLQF